MILNTESKKTAQQLKETNPKMAAIQQKVKSAGEAVKKYNKPELNILLNEYSAQMFFLS
jgi:hypothetical protein